MISTKAIQVANSYRTTKCLHIYNSTEGVITKYLLVPRRCLHPRRKTSAKEFEQLQPERTSMPPYPPSSGRVIASESVIVELWLIMLIQVLISVAKGVVSSRNSSGFKPAQNVTAGRHIGVQCEGKLLLSDESMRLESASRLLNVSKSMLE